MIALAIHSFLLISGIAATIDPPNATVIEVQPGHFYNVTHLYFRNAFKELGVKFDEKTCRCSQDNSVQHIRYWINELQMPRKIRVFDKFNRYVDHETLTEIRSDIDTLIQRLARELELRVERIDRDEYYTLMDGLLLEVRNYQGLIPIEIHFRSKPYPQSTFLEFVTNRDVRWEVYDDQVYAAHAGRELDLLYRFRHNFRHSLGLGHANNRRSVMFPTNVLGLSQINPMDVLAVHVLLCSNVQPQPRNQRENFSSVIKVSEPVKKQPPEGSVRIISPNELDRFQFSLP